MTNAWSRGGSNAGERVAFARIFRRHPERPLLVDRNGIHHSLDARCPIRNLRRGSTHGSRADLTREINHVLNGLHMDPAQVGKLLERGLDGGLDLRVVTASTTRGRCGNAREGGCNGQSQGHDIHFSKISHVKSPRSSTHASLSTDEYQTTPGTGLLRFTATVILHMF